MKILGEIMPPCLILLPTWINLDWDKDKLGQIHVFNPEYQEQRTQMTAKGNPAWIKVSRRDAWDMLSKAPLISTKRAYSRWPEILASSITLLKAA